MISNHSPHDDKSTGLGAECESAMKNCPVVVLGASAGGLEVFQQFFQGMPGDSGMAFLLVQHLDPKHETLMPELLSKYTAMQVRCIEHGQAVEANHVYVIPPGVAVEMENCHFCLRPATAHPERKPIDQAFRTVADDQEENVVAVVLSGTGADGSLGLKWVKEQGGLTMAQSPETARFDAMPRHAIASGFVDCVLAVDQMPKRIVEYVAHLNKLQQRKGAEAIQKQVVEHLPRIFPVLRKQTGHDFSRYKQSTLVRRIQRRMQVQYLDSVPRYVDFLLQTPDEIDALFKDLLIGVTEFFRDPESFEAVAKKVIAPLVSERQPESKIRIWVPGCATGEEAYSFAMLLSEALAGAAGPHNVQVFATDIDVEALDFARKGRYPIDVQEQVSAERLDRFFRKVGDSYEIVEEIRAMCVFSPHNLVKDPPFSRLDLLSCRNLLIYFEADLQKKLLPLFHYALNPSGHLFLGPSENLASRSDLFHPVDQKHRIYQRKPTVLHDPATRLPVIDRGGVTKFHLAAPIAGISREQTVTRSIERVILEEFAPASAVINAQGDVLYFSGNIGTYLEPAVGVPSNKIVVMARKSLRLELRTLIHRAVSTGEEAVRENMRVKLGRETRQLDLIVRPLPELGNDPALFIVTFRELLEAPDSGVPATETFVSHEHPIIKQLEAELQSTREDLQTTIEELETSNEELKSANEELLSMNEELQSANEELQTSKEEVQVANDELQRKIEEADASAAELRRAHESLAMLAAIVQNSDDAIISKSLDGIITTWNKGAERVFGYKAQEIVGKSIFTIIPAELRDDEVDILARLRRGERIEHYETERITKAGRRIAVSLTASPIRDADGYIIGAAKIARDITDRKHADEARNRLAALVESSDDAIVTKTLEGVVTSWNRGAQHIFGYNAEEIIGKSVMTLIPVDRRDEEPRILERLRRGERIDHYETVRQRKDGSLISVSLTVSPIRNAAGKIVGASKIARDITERKKAEEAKNLLIALVESSDDAIITKDLSGTITSWNKAAQRTFGYSADEAIGRNITMLFPPSRLDEEPAIMDRLRKGLRIEHFETVRMRKDGSPIDISLTISPIKDALGRIIGASKIARDVSERKKAQHARYLLGAVVESSDDAIITKDLNGIVTSWNKAAERMYGYSAEEIIGKPVTILIPADRQHEEPTILERLRNGFRIDHYETIRQRKDGTLFNVSLTVSPVRDAFGTVVGASKIARDITDQKRAEEELQRAKEELEQRVKERTATLQEATEQLETFCYSIVHDLRSPLRVQQSFAQVLLEDYKDVLDEKGRQYGERIISNAQRLDKLVSDLLSYSRLSRDEIKFSPVDLTKVVSEVQVALSETIHQGNATITVGQLHVVFAHEPTLQLVVMNLVSNGLKFMPAGVEPQLKIWSEQELDRIKLWVEDNGIGISPEHTPKIFGVFQRLHPVGKYPGTGIGLAIVKKGVERMGGSVGVESELGKGSRFWIELPAAIRR